MIRFLKNVIHHFLAVIANIYYGFPGRHLTVIGVTGTDGKTTTTSMIYHILITAGKKAAMISTVNALVDGKTYDTGFHTTTPSPFQVQKLLAKARQARAEYVVLEATSMGLDQYRVWGIPFRVGVITNITPEHLDYHKTYERYVRAKYILLRNAQTRIINRDDMSFEPLKKLLERDGRSYISVSLKHTDAPMYGDIAAKAGVDMPLFNRYNALSAYAVAREVGITDTDVVRAFKTFALPTGRFEIIKQNGITALIDFAHTPHSFTQILPEARSHLKRGGKLFHIFGSAAHRDKQKRPEMGAISAQFSDIIIVTEEDYRTEDPLKIAENIGQGIRRGGFKHVSAKKLSRELERKYAIITNRQEAIRTAVQLARPGDVILTTGKGHEPTLCRGKTEYPWNERQEVLDALSTRHSAL